MDPQKRPSAVLPQCPACGAPLSLLSLASPGLALRGEPVQRDNPCATQSPLRCGTGPSRPWLGRSAGEGPPDLHVNYRLTYWTFVLSASPLPGPLRGSACEGDRQGKDCPDVHGRTNAAYAWMRRSGQQSFCISTIAPATYRDVGRYDSRARIVPDNRFAFPPSMVVRRGR